MTARGAMTTVRKVPSRVLRGLVRFYQLAISPWTPPSCKYYPSCSQYALVALERHGAVRGTWLAVRRVGRCHPWAAGGVDDVPPIGYWRTADHTPITLETPAPVPGPSATTAARPGHAHAHRG